MTSRERGRARRLLCDLQDGVRERLLKARDAGRRDLSGVAAVTAADTIYKIDRIGEGAILEWFERKWPEDWPVEIVMEGLEDGATTFPSGTPARRTRFKCIIDPIDGTRCLMHDKRPGWSLAGLAPQRGARTSLVDIQVAAMTELPTSKQGRADQFSAIRGQGVRAQTIDLRDGRRRAFAPRPSSASHFGHGFASFVRFFPEGKALTAQIEEELWKRVPFPAGSTVFDDQYLSTGGQLSELLLGHDRMAGDLRPLVHAKLGLNGLPCHPYDICTALILTEAGGIVETPSGRPLSSPLDTTTPVAWVGYANPILARLIRPVLRRLVRQFL